MRILPDTHVLLQAAAMPEQLTRETRDLIENPETELVFSAASIREVAIENGLGRDGFRVDRASCAGSCWRTAIRRSRSKAEFVLKNFPGSRRVPVRFRRAREVRAGAGPEMTDQLRAVGEELLFTLTRPAGEGEAQAKRHLLLVARNDGDAGEIEFAATTDDANLKDQMALLGERAAGPQVEEEVSLRLPRHSASRCATSSSTIRTWSRSAWDWPPRCERSPGLMDERTIMDHVPQCSRDASTATMAQPAAHTLSAALDRIAQAAADDLGRAFSKDFSKEEFNEKEAFHQARKMVNRYLLGAVAVLAASAALGAITGWTVTAKFLRPAEGPVHAALALLAIVGFPWLILALRHLVLALLQRSPQVLLELFKSVTNWLLRTAGQDTAARDPDFLSNKTNWHIWCLLKKGGGERLAAVWTGTFWMAYAVAAIAAIWIVTARGALGFDFGWESSWIPPSFGRAVVEFAPLIGNDELVPIAAASVAPADDPAALAARRAWLHFLTANVAVYLLLLMAVYTLWQAVLGRRHAVHWEPMEVRPCKYVVKLKRPEQAVGLPDEFGHCEPLNKLAKADTDAELLKRALDAIHNEPDHRVAIVGWLPAKPDRRVQKGLSKLADDSHQPLLLVLDGGNVLRREESAGTAAAHLKRWRMLARKPGIDLFECDLAELTNASRQLLDNAVGGKTATNGAGLEPTDLDPTLLDNAFSVIRRHLENDDRLLTDTARNSCLKEVARTFGAKPSAEALSAGLAAALSGLDPSDASRPRLRTLRAGLRGFARLCRLRSLQGGEEAPAPALDKAVFAAVKAAAEFAVLWWAQGADEDRTTRALEALEALAPPAPDNAVGAKRWLTVARNSVVAAADGHTNTGETSLLHTLLRRKRAI